MDKEIDETAEKIVSEIERTNTADLTKSDELVRIMHLTDVRQTKKLLNHMEHISAETERDMGKKAVIKAMLLSTWLQRLYFIVRSIVMGAFSSLFGFLFILYFGSIDVALGVVLGITSFIISLLLSRLLDTQIVKITRAIVAWLNKHKRTREFVLSHF